MCRMQLSYDMAWSLDERNLDIPVCLCFANEGGCINICTLSLLIGTSWCTEEIVSVQGVVKKIKKPQLMDNCGVFANMSFDKGAALRCGECANTSSDEGATRHILFTNYLFMFAGSLLLWWHKILVWLYILQHVDALQYGVSWFNNIQSPLLAVKVKGVCLFPRRWFKLQIQVIESRKNFFCCVFVRVCLCLCPCCHLRNLCGIPSCWLISSFRPGGRIVHHITGWVLYYGQVFRVFQVSITWKPVLSGPSNHSSLSSKSRWIVLVLFSGGGVSCRFRILVPGKFFTVV